MDWLTPGIIVALLSNLVVLASLWGKMNANMANLGDKMEAISGDVHAMRTAIVELGKLAERISERVNGHDKQLDRLDRVSGASRLP